MNNPKFLPLPALVLVILGLSNLSRAESLPALSIDKAKITASGLSSGAIMAQQLLITNSSRISGIGSFAGSVFGCGEGGLTLAKECLKNPDQVSTLAMSLRTKQLEKNQSIDPIAGISKARLYLFQGRKDTAVDPASIESITSYYMRLLDTAPPFKMHVDPKAAHGIPTESKGGDCSAQDPSGLLNCGFDGIGQMLTYLYPDLKAIGNAVEQNLSAFDQMQFTDANSGLGSDGYVYVPAACHTKSCGLHIALHGCRQNPELVNDVFYKQTSYNAWAESNDLVILYPSTRLTSANPDGCWDWWGYTGRDFLTKNGAQISAITKMIDRLESSTLKNE